MQRLANEIDILAAKTLCSFPCNVPVAFGIPFYISSKSENVCACCKCDIMSTPMWRKGATLMSMSGIILHANVCNKCGIKLTNIKNKY